MEKIKRHEKLCKEMHELYCSKNKDYGDSFGISFKELGIISAVTRMGDKFNRIKNLSLKNERAVQNEKLKDTLIDLANYAIMTILEMEQSEREPLDE